MASLDISSLTQVSDGSTTLTKSLWDAWFTAVQTAVNSIATNQIANSAVTRAKMASGNQDVIQAITIPFTHDQITIGSNSVCGIEIASSTSPAYSGPVRVKSAGTIVGVDYAFSSVESAFTATVEVGDLSTMTAATATATSFSAAGTYGEKDGLTVTVSDNQYLRVKFTVSSGTNIGAAGGFAVIYFKRTLA